MPQWILGLCWIAEAIIVSCVTLYLYFALLGKVRSYWLRVLIYLAVLPIGIGWPVYMAFMGAVVLQTIIFDPGFDILFCVLAWAVPVFLFVMKVRRKRRI